MGRYTAAKPGGYLVIVDPDAPKIIEADTVQCCHCGAIWKVQPGSGKVRGFCAECNGVTCGPNCPSKVPVEQWLENSEKGRPLDYKPIMEQVLGV